jgi:S-adenosylmethionine/arginine decarboxylase-like enzyme
MGRLLARFSNCDAAALVDVGGLVRALRRATAAAGATRVQSAEERFAPDGFVAAIVTCESETRLRTLPEQAACFVEFRFDDGCRADAFEKVLGGYLRSRRRAPVTVHPAALQRSAEATTAPRSA